MLKHVHCHSMFLIQIFIFQANEYGYMQTMITSKDFNVETCSLSLSVSHLSMIVVVGRLDLTFTFLMLPYYNIAPNIVVINKG